MLPLIPAKQSKYIARIVSPQFIYLAGQSSRPKAIINIHDRYAHGTAVEHRQQRCHPME
jgi:hypothetical protein